MEFLHPLYWHWFALGLVLMMVELLLPGFFFLWLGVSALAVGVLVLAISDISFAVQGATFAVMGVLSFYLSRKYFKARQAGFGPNKMNKRGAQLIGAIVEVETAIENGHGKVTVGDSLWSATGPNAAAGTRVKITSVNGTVLGVEPV